MKGIPPKLLQKSSILNGEHPCLKECAILPSEHSLFSVERVVDLLVLTTPILGRQSLGRDFYLSLSKAVVTYK